MARFPLNVAVAWGTFPNGDMGKKGRRTPQPCPTFASRSAGATLPRRDRQEPHQQPEQEQSADQRKQCVQRVEMEVGIAIETMPRRQHRPSFARAERANRAT